MKKVFVIMLIGLLAVSLLCGCADANDVTVRVSEVTHSVFYAPQYVAINLGYFADEGINIELINGQGADKVMTAVLSDQVDIGFSGPEAAIYVYNEGKEDYCEVFAQLTKRDGSLLVGRQPEPDFQWENLKDKIIIGGRKGGVPFMTLEYVIKQSGLTPGSDVILDDTVQFALTAGAFAGGKGDYVTCFEPVATALENEGRGFIVASVGQESGEIPYTAYFAKKSYIQNNEELIKKFTRAIYRGQKFVMQSSPEEIAQVIAPSFPDTDIKVLETVVKRYKELDVWNATPVLEEAAYHKLQQVMQEAGELKQTAPYEKVVNNTYAKAVLK